MRKTSTGWLFSLAGPGHDRYMYHIYTGDMQAEAELFRNKGD